MSQIMIRLHARPPLTATRLLSLRPTSSHLSIQRLQHRAFHITSPHHRRPPPIRIVKPKPAPPPPPPKPQPQPRKPPPTATTTQHPASQSPKPATNPGPRPKRTLRWSFQRFRRSINWKTEILITLALLAVFTPVLKTIDATNPPAPNNSSSSSNSANPCLNPATFTPFTITARAQLSPTAFVLTVRPSDPALGRAVVADAWRRGLWAVEVKQPECMVAREYTPLPDLPGLPGLSGLSGLAGSCGDGDGDGDGGVLRLYIRRMQGGEVSGYLARLAVGDEIGLRGPRLGFDLRARLGVGVDGEGGGEVAKGDDGGGDRDGKKKVVFLAGGTGIAPALQAAKAVLVDPRVEMEVVWANRRREDCVGCGESREEQQGEVLALLEGFRSRYGGRFRYSCTVDEEGSFIDPGAVARLTSPAPPAAASNRTSWGLWSAGGVSPKDNSLSTTVNSDACAYHSASKLVSSDDRDPLAGTSNQPCRCKDAHGNPVQGGKNLLMLSGPDGFIAHLAGLKVWSEGKERQGPVTGVIGDLKRKNPGLGQDWLVLKM